MKTWMKAALATMLAVAAPGAAQAALFDYSFTLNGSNGDTYVASGQLDASATGTASQWKVDDVTGKVTSDFGNSFDVLGLSGFMNRPQTFSLGSGRITAIDLALATSNMFFIVQGKRETGYDGSFGGEVFGAVTASITPSAGAVPEPATWALMLVGFGAAGAALRRRRTMQPAHA